MFACSGISDIPYMLESSKGYRCGVLAELHKTHSVIRIGPNSLSYCDQRAIKARDYFLNSPIQANRRCAGYIRPWNEVHQG